MAIGDIKNVTVLANGSFVDITIEGLSTGGTYNFGLGAGNDPATGLPKVVFTVVSQGYTNGVLGTRTRTLYGTTRVRKPFSVSGNELTAQESISGSDVIVRVALNESIYDSDNSSGGTGGNSGTAPTVTILAGFYTQAGTPNNAATGMAVTNNSTLAYPRVIGNWSRAIEFEKVGASIRLGATVFHGHAQMHPTAGNGQQVDSVKFIAADASGHSQTVGVIAATIDATYGDAVPVIEHVADMNTSGFTQGDVGTFNFIAYPYIGNGASVLDTAGTTSGSTAGTGTASAPSPYYGTRFFICDPAGTYCTSFAVVDTANGGVGAVGVGALNPGSPPAAYATMAAAFDALRTYNNTNYGRNNCGGSIMYLRDNAGGINSFAWMGATPTVGTRPSCVLTITRFPGHSRSNVVIASQSGGKNAGELVKLLGVKVTAANAGGVIDTNSTTSYLVYDECEIDSSTSPIIYRTGVWHTARCLITNFAQGWACPGGVNSSPGLNRGNTIAPTITSLGRGQAYVTIGNLKTNPLAHEIGRAAASPAPNSQNMVVAYNRITAGNTSAPIISGGFNTNAHGSAFVQNVVENCNNSSPAMQIAADASNTDANNILIFHNVIVGQRCSLAYNEYGVLPYARLNWFVKNNIIDDLNIKTDTYTGNTATATRVFSAGTVTVTVTLTGHQYQNGDLIYINSATPVAYKTNGVAVSSVTANTFVYSFAAGADPGAITQMAIAPHPGRIGNWPVVYGVNHSGNVIAETASIGAPGTFLPNFTGLRSLPASVAAVEPPTTPTNVLAYLKFIDRKSFNGTTTGPGGGDYHLQADSPAVGRAREWIMPYGLDGSARRLNGASGAYELASSGLLLARRRRCR